mmetsp:Transcript_18652/g.60267  ORF Transcript_18652/g.60267 Transcript_18652/m.60267 type:complete len:360 (+) Transcript_18652:2973-4052(+)
MRAVRHGLVTAGGAGVAGRIAAAGAIVGVAVAVVGERVPIALVVAVFFLRGLSLLLGLVLFLGLTGGGRLPRRLGPLEATGFRRLDLAHAAARVAELLNERAGAELEGQGVGRGGGALGDGGIDVGAPRLGDVRARRSVDQENKRSEATVVEPFVDAAALGIGVLPVPRVRVREGLGRGARRAGCRRGRRRAGRQVGEDALGVLRVGGESKRHVLRSRRERGPLVVELGPFLLLLVGEVGVLVRVVLERERLLPRAERGDAKALGELLRFARAHPGPAGLQGARRLLELRRVAADVRQNPPRGRDVLLRRRRRGDGGVEVRERVRSRHRFFPDQDGDKGLNLDAESVTAEKTDGDAWTR